ncbi:MAG: ribosome recycling factor [Patescibacteria group bacterium]
MESILKTLQEHTVRAMQGLHEDLAGVRANRPSPSLVEDIQVPYMDQQFRVKQLAAISVLPPYELQIAPWDKGSLPAIAKAIESAPIGLSPLIDGMIIRLKLPSLTLERRDELAKFAKAMAEKTRIKIRSIRDDANKKLEQEFKAKTVTEDGKFSGKKKIQEQTDKANKEIDGILEKKIREISE